MAILRKQTVRAGSGSLDENPLVRSLLLGYPALMEFLTMERWEEDGSARKVGTLLCFCDDGGLKVMLNDKDGHKVKFVVCEDGEGILEAAERGLTSCSTKWIESKEWQPRKKS